MREKADSYNIGLYLWIEKNKPITEHLQAAIDYCKGREYSILLTADTNSHSKAWGNETNTRGKNGKN